MLEQNFKTYTACLARLDRTIYRLSLGSAVLEVKRIGLGFYLAHDSSTALLTFISSKPINRLESIST